VGIMERAGDELRWIFSIYLPRDAFRRWRLAIGLQPPPAYDYQHALLGLVG